MSQLRQATTISTYIYIYNNLKPNDIICDCYAALHGTRDIAQHLLTPSGYLNNQTPTMVHEDNLMFKSGQVPALLFRYDTETFTKQLTICDNCY